MNALIAIFGPDSKNSSSSGDPVQDKNISSAFVDRLRPMHRWRHLVDGSQMLLVGADNFPFPIPLKKNAEGKWFFDMAAGKDEVLNRRIGRNELAIIDVCDAAAEAQAEYYANPHDGEKAKLFAAKFLSDPGKQNGFTGRLKKASHPARSARFSPTRRPKDIRNPKVPDPSMAIFQGAQGPNRQGSRWRERIYGRWKNVRRIRPCRLPADYGNSGIMTFIINQDGVLLQKDLGKSTAETATAMTLFDPDPDWIIVVP